jgi:hypothetical protein
MIGSVIDGYSVRFFDGDAIMNRKFVGAFAETIGVIASTVIPA